MVMKKRLSVILVIVLVFSLLAGCTGGKSENPVPTVEPPVQGDVSPEKPAEPGSAEASAVPASPAPTEEPIPAAVPGMAVSAEKNAEYYYADDGSLLLSWSCAVPRVYLAADPEAEHAINEDLYSENLRFIEGEELEEGTLSGLDGYLSAAREDYAFRAENGYTDYFAPYALERSVSVCRVSGRVISLIYDDYSYAGGVHGYTARSGIAYDAATGSRLLLEDISVDYEAFQNMLLQKLLDQTHNSALYDPEMFFPGYEEWLPEILRDGLWYFNDTGMVFIANPYHLAPYAAGRIEFTLFYGELMPLLKEDYLPVSGVAYGSARGEITSDGEPVFVLDDVGNLYPDFNGTPVTFTADGDITDFEVQRLYYCENYIAPEEPGWFEYGDVIFRAEVLHEGESVRIYTSIPDVVPNLYVSWNGLAGSVGYMISQSGEDGSLRLMEVMG